MPRRLPALPPLGVAKGPRPTSSPRGANPDCQEVRRRATKQRTGESRCADICAVVLRIAEVFSGAECWRAPSACLPQ
eukprot:11186797-Lingulodinium_polyedra.AAC.1